MYSDEVGDFIMRIIDTENFLFSAPIGIILYLVHYTRKAVIIVIIIEIIFFFNLCKIGSPESLEIKTTYLTH